MSVVYIVLSIILAVVCIAVNIMILMQNKRSAGLSGVVSGMNTGGTYYDKNKGRSREGMLERYSKLGGFLFMLLCLVLSLIK